MTDSEIEIEFDEELSEEGEDVIDTDVNYLYIDQKQLVPTRRPQIVDKEPKELKEEIHTVQDIKKEDIKKQEVSQIDVGDFKLVYCFYPKEIEKRYCSPLGKYMKGKDWYSNKKNSNDVRCASCIKSGIVNINDYVREEENTEALCDSTIYNKYYTMIYGDYSIRVRVKDHNSYLYLHPKSKVNLGVAIFRCPCITPFVIEITNNKKASFKVRLNDRIEKYKASGEIDSPSFIFTGNNSLYELLIEAPNTNLKISIQLVCSDSETEIAQYNRRYSNYINSIIHSHISSIDDEISLLEENIQTLKEKRDIYSSYYKETSDIIKIDPKNLPVLNISHEQFLIK